jgi:hypothetical protein
VQFPWLAMKNAIDIGRRVLHDREVKSIVSSRASNAQMSSGGQALSSSFGNSSAHTSGTSASQHQLVSTSGNNGDELHSPAARTYPSATNQSADGNLPMISPFKSPTATYWKAMKRDPTLPIIQHSPCRKQSTINSTFKQTHTSLKILESTAVCIHTEDCRLFGGKAGHPSHIKLNASKYRRSIDEENEALKGDDRHFVLFCLLSFAGNAFDGSSMYDEYRRLICVCVGIPHSDHTVRSLRQRTLFPTIEQMTRERNILGSVASNF